MVDVPQEVTKRLAPLVGVRLTVARRAADLRGFHFGEMHELRGGNGGDYVLHIQCPWRLMRHGQIVTGRADLWELPTSLKSTVWRPDEWDNWDYEQGNLQDERIGELLGGVDEKTKSALNATDELVVESARGEPGGGATLCLSGGYTLELFPTGSVGEDWRLLGQKLDGHFVIAGGLIEQ